MGVHQWLCPREIDGRRHEIVTGNGDVASAARRNFSGPLVGAAFVRTDFGTYSIYRNGRNTVSATDIPLAGTYDRRFSFCDDATACLGATGVSAKSHCAPVALQFARFPRSRSDSWSLGLIILSFANHSHEIFNPRFGNEHGEVYRAVRASLFRPIRGSLPTCLTGAVAEAFAWRLMWFSRTLREGGKIKEPTQSRQL